MATFVALLRGINVGGHKVIKMEDLREIVEQTGGKNVQTYIQSGNVVFDHAARSGAALTPMLSDAIMKGTGFDVSVVVRSAREMALTIDENPFKKADPDQLHVFFLPAKAPPDLLKKFNQKPFAPEKCVAARDVYAYLPNGMGNSKIVAALGKLPALQHATARNWRTVSKLLEMANA